MPKAPTYKIICISMYHEDLERLNEKVKALKVRGMAKANRSFLIRYALARLNLSDVK